MNRRRFLASLAAAPLFGSALAQRQALIAALSVGGAETSRRNVDLLTEGMRELGHVYGRTFHIEERYWGGEGKTLGPLIRELLAGKPDVLVIGGTNVAQAVKQATRSTPVVVAFASDLVTSGIVSGYAQPGGNVTGFTTLTDVVVGKRLEILAEAAPAARKIALLQNPVHPLTKSIESRARTVAGALRIDLSTLHATDLGELEAALDKLGGMRVNGVLVSSNALFLRHSSLLIERAMKQKAFVAHWQPYTAQQGAFLVQGVDMAKQFKRAASYVDRILKGARPADLPVEQVTSDELIVNLRTAKALGIAVPQSVLLRADKVIR